MQCTEVQDALAAYSAEALDSTEAVRLRAHLNLCAECRREWRALLATMNALDAIPRRELPRDLWPDIAGRIAAGARRARPSLAAELLTWLRGRRRVFALASVSTVVAVTLLIVNLAPRAPEIASTPLAAHAATYAQGHVLMASAGPVADPVARAMLARLTGRAGDHLHANTSPDASGAAP